jgi:creatinine amidohydrolase/Fe(II)-dependent formamide hydrolase-like protein
MRIAMALFLALHATFVFSQPSGPSLDEPRPIAAFDSVFIEELTWMEVRDAIRAGKTTAIVATGGIEQNGPYLVTGKHNVVLRGVTEAIARKLGNALVAPILSLVPEGDFSPPTGHMRYPGTIGLTEGTFKAVLRDVAESLKVGGFQHIVFIGDSGGNQKGMRETAEELNRAWAGKPRVHFVAEFYDYPGLQKWLDGKGYHQVDQGLHDDFGITSIMASVDPGTVRYSERVKAGLDSINGVSLTPIEKTREVGRAAVEWRASVTVEAIRKAISTAATSEP